MYVSDLALQVSGGLPSSAKPACSEQTFCSALSWLLQEFSATSSIRNAPSKRKMNSSSSPRHPLGFQGETMPGISLLIISTLAAVAPCCANLRDETLYSAYQAQLNKYYPALVLSKIQSEFSSLVWLLVPKLFTITSTCNFKNALHKLSSLHNFHLSTLKHPDVYKNPSGIDSVQKEAMNSKASVLFPISAGQTEGGVPDRRFQERKRSKGTNTPRCRGCPLILGLKQWQ